MKKSISLDSASSLDKRVEEEEFVDSEPKSILLMREKMLRSPTSWWLS